VSGKNDKRRYRQRDGNAMLPHARFILQTTEETVRETNGNAGKYRIIPAPKPCKSYAQRPLTGNAVFIGILPTSNRQAGSFLEARNGKNLRTIPNINSGTACHQSGENYTSARRAVQEGAKNRAAIFRLRSRR